MKKGKENGGLLVLVDVGNTNTVFGIYRGDELVESWMEWAVAWHVRRYQYRYLYRVGPQTYHIPRST